MLVGVLIMIAQFSFPVSSPDIWGVGHQAERTEAHGVTFLIQRGGRDLEFQHLSEVPCLGSLWFSTDSSVFHVFRYLCSALFSGGVNREERVGGRSCVPLVYSPPVLSLGTSHGREATSRRKGRLN